MSAKPEQHRLTFHGRELHFVAYEGTPMEYVIGQSVEERDRVLRKWAEENAIGPLSDRTVRATARKQTADVRRDDWWSRP